MLSLGRCGWVFCNSLHFSFQAEVTGQQKDGFGLALIGSVAGQPDFIPPRKGDRIADWWRAFWETPGLYVEPWSEICSLNPHFGFMATVAMEKAYVFVA